MARRWIPILTVSPSIYPWDLNITLGGRGSSHYWAGWSVINPRATASLLQRPWSRLGGSTLPVPPVLSALPTRLSQTAQTRKLSWEAEPGLRGRTPCKQQKVRGQGERHGKKLLPEAHNGLWGSDWPHNHDLASRKCRFLTNTWFCRNFLNTTCKVEKF